MHDVNRVDLDHVKRQPLDGQRDPRDDSEPVQGNLCLLDPFNV